jgi:hypothetical protein
VGLVKRNSIDIRSSVSSGYWSVQQFVPERLPV